MNALAELMKDVAQAQREHLARTRPCAGLEAQLAFGAGPRRWPARLGRFRARRLGWLVGLSLPACATAIVLLAWRGSPPQAMRTGPHESRLWSFADGSEVKLGPDTEVRLASPPGDAHQVHLAVEHGVVDVHVVHHDDTRWQVEAGGRVVHVVGTRFREAWDASSRTFSVDMEEGAVEVTGVGLLAPQRLRAGERLRASEDGLTVSPRGLAAPASAATSAEAPAPAEAPSSGAAASNVAPREGGPTAAREASGWRELARKGAFKEAMRVAVRQDSFAETARLKARDLILLGDVARIAGDATRAEQVYRQAASRFPDADAAVFSLGLVAFDARHQHGEAARWFSRYLARFPEGDFAQEAAGRLIEAEVGAGQRQAARAAARRYLALYPAGPHARLAATTLGREAPAP